MEKFYDILVIAAFIFVIVIIITTVAIYNAETDGESAFWGATFNIVFICVVAVILLLIYIILYYCRYCIP